MPGCRGRRRRRHASERRLGCSTVVDHREHESNGHVAEAEHYLRAHEERIAATGVPVSSEVVVGAPADEIIAHASASELTVMTYPGGRWLFGGALDRVVKEMKNPVVIVRGKEGQTLPDECSKVIAPIKLSAHSRMVLPTAVELCKEMNANLTLLSVIAPVAGAYDKANPPHEIAQYHEEQWMVAEEKMSVIVKELAGTGLQVDYLLSFGDPAREITKAARETGAGLIAMATQGSDSLSQMMGSVAIGVVQANPVPCLLVPTMDA
jgi:nucleotide-binding universal stress UspA family protein